jgi:uncharacterized protein YxeA
MKNSLIIILVIALLIVGWVLYFFRDDIKGMYDDRSPDVKEEMIDAKEELIDAKEDMKDAAAEVKEDIAEWVEDLKD